MKRLLAVSWEMPPMYGPRGAQVSRLLAHLPPLGWRPTVVCLAPRRGGPHWPDGEASEPPPPDVEYLRVPSPEEWWVVRAARRLAPPLGNRPDSARLWVAGAARAAEGVVGSRDVAGMITFAQPWSDHLVGLRVRRSTKIPWVAHFSDPWASSPYATPHQRSIWRRLEESVIRDATAVVFVTRETADLTMAPYPAEWQGKVAVVPHGYDPSVPPRPRIAPPSTNQPLRLIYTGRFYAGIRTPAALLEALAALDRESPLRDAIAVSFVGPHVEAFRPRAAALGLDRVVTFAGRVPRGEAARLAAAADVLLVIDAPSAMPSVFLPSKLIHYLPFRKPIFGITPLEGASARLLARLGCPVAAPEDVEGIRSIVRALIAQWRSGTLGVGDAFDRVAAEFDIRCTARRLDDVLNSAFG